MKKFFLILIILFPAIASGQFISGKIIDSCTGKGVPDATIRWILDKTGTSTNSEGAFSIGRSAFANDSLEVSHLAYKTTYISCRGLVPGISIGVPLEPLLHTMPILVVTATREEQDLMRIPQKTTVIDSMLLHALPLQSIDDALIYSSGVMIDRPLGIFAAKSVVTMRGLSGNEQGRTLVLMDGIPINKSDGGTVNYNLIDPLLTERIEVVKGPSSALYGGNAMGGVINIISAFPKEKLSGRVKLGYGTYNAMSGDAALNGFTGKTSSRGFFWSGSAMWRSSDGYISEPEYQRTEYTVPVFVREQIFSLKTGYKFNNKSHLWVSGLLYNDERGGGEKVFEELGSFTEHDSYHFRGSYKNEFKGWKTTIHGFYLRENYAKINEYMKAGEYTLYDVDSKRTDLGFIAHASKSFKSNVLTTGIEIRQGAVDAADEYHTSTDKIINAGIMDNFALFFQDEFTFGKDRWKLVSGIRFDYAGFHDGRFSVENPSASNLYLLNYATDNMEKNSWKSLSPKVALLYRMNEQARVYASYSHGFRAPILDDLCRSGKTRGGFQIAHPTLVPETIENFEIGFRKVFTNSLTLEPVVYYSIGKNFMYSVATGDTVDMGYAAPVIVTSNVTEVNILGAELDITFNINKKLMVFANYAFAHSTVAEYTPELLQQIDISGLYLSNVPKHLANAGFRFIYQTAGISVNARYVGKRWANDTNTPDEKYGLPAEYNNYLTADVRIWKQFGKYWLIGASVVNTTNVLYTDGKGQLSPGRMILMEAGIKF